MESGLEAELTPARVYTKKTGNVTLRHENQYSLGSGLQERQLLDGRWCEEGPEKDQKDLGNQRE